jgi:hypothetical protein
MSILDERKTVRGWHNVIRKTAKEEKGIDVGSLIATPLLSDEVKKSKNRIDLLEYLEIVMKETTNFILKGMAQKGSLDKQKELKKSSRMVVKGLEELRSMIQNKTI